MKNQNDRISFCRLLEWMLAGALAMASLAGIGLAQQPSPAEIDSQVNAMLAKLTLQEKITLIGGVDGMFTNAMPQIGLPRLKMSDGPVGVRTWGPDTAYAAGIGLAASWDTALARQVGESLGHDARARGVNFLLGPGVDIYRLPLNGRNFEYFGEDPWLASRIAVNYIKGVQSQHVVATIKHYALNNAEYDRHNENSIVGARALHEIYLPTFEAAVKEAHVGAVMDSYNLIDGAHATQNGVLNNEILKKDWGFRGIVMSDWDATYNGVAAANNGLDLEMPSPRFMNERTLLPAIQSGQVTEATIDDKVRRILRVALEFGFINHNQQDLNIPLYNEQSREAALKSAEEGMVLLKNKGGILPLDLSKIHSVAIIGPDAYPAEASAGGSAHVTPFAAISFLQGVSDALGAHVHVYWSSGVKDLPSIFMGPGGFSGSSFSTDEQGTHPGLKQEEFEGSSFTGQPTSVRTVMRINSYSGNEFAPPSRTRRAIRWSGYYTPKVAGPQTFIAASVGGDAYKLYVNDKLALERKAGEGQAPQAVDIDLPTGKPASVRFDYLPVTGRIRAGLGVIPESEMLEPDVKKIASMADVVILSVGFNPRAESEGHDRTYSLPLGQNQLIKTVLAANPHTIVVITSGGSVETSPWISETPAVLEGWYGGSEGGRALAQILLGRVDPSGKLPISWERRIEDDPAYKNYYEEPGTHNIKYREGIFLGYRYFDRSDVKPLFPFGFGLSYTTFAFSRLRVTPSAASENGPIHVSFDVRNAGHVAGAEVAQVYVGDPSATVERPVKELKGFERVMLSPGETKRVDFVLDRRSLAYWDVSSKGWKVDPGKFVIYAGDSSENVPLKADFTVR
ncbi:MAG: glycoside hydrolase family 3 C-terminal domain-containing protein [Acidobacteriota bacterium]|nr:glycoside hydrolase family 3 C-terminal domain-containing protein [Acidobacteriota bacterium]